MLYHIHKSNTKRPNFYFLNSDPNDVAREVSISHQSPYNLMIYKILTPHIPYHLRQNLEKKFGMSSIANLLPTDIPSSYRCIQSKGGISKFKLAH